MITGLPGTGIGGVFYILLALWMPARELWRAANGRRDQEKRRIMRTQGVLTVFMVPAILAAGWAAGWLFWALVPHAISASAGATSAGSSAALRNVLRLWPVLLTLATLAFVYLALRAVQAVLRRRAPRPRRTPQPPVGLSERSAAPWRTVVPARARVERESRELFVSLWTGMQLARDTEPPGDD